VNIMRARNVFIATLLALTCSSACAQAYPVKPIRMVVPFAAAA